jgi:RHS repeat-associated protein
MNSCYTDQKHAVSTGGLMYYNARYYLPELRRFISADRFL